MPDVRQELSPEVETIVASKQIPVLRLSELDPLLLLTESQVAPVLGVTKRCLQNWRMIGYGPKFVRLSGSAIRYRVLDTVAFIASKVRTSTSEPDPDDQAA